MSKSKPGWRRVNLGDVVCLDKETCRNPLGEGIERFIGLEHLKPGDLRIRSWGEVSGGNTFTNRVRPGQVLFGKRRAYQRKVAVSEFDAVCSGDIYVLVSKDPSKLLPELLPYICMTNAFFDHAISTSAGSLSPRTNWSRLAEFEFSLPPLEEQRHIFTLVEAWQELIRSLEDSREAAQEAEEAQFVYFLNGGGICRSEKKLSQFGQIPKHWEISRVAELGDVAYGISAAVADNTDPTSGDPILTGANISLDGTLDLTKLVYFPTKGKSAFLLQRGDVLLNWRSGSLAHVGKAAIFNLDGNWTCASFILRLRPGSDVNNQFVWRLFNFMRKHQLFSRGMSQQINFKMNAAHFRAIEVPNPPRIEQDEIVSAMRVIWNSTEALNERLNTAQKQMQLVLGTILEG